MNESLTTTEESRLNELQGIVTRGLATFVDVGNALLEIRDSRLYRASHGTFEAYCENQFQLSYRRAAQLITAAEVVNDLATENMKHVSGSFSEDRNMKHVSGSTPEIKNERQALALASVPKTKRAAVLKKAAESGERDENDQPKLTAKSIAQAAEVVDAEFESIPILRPDASAPSQVKDRVGQIIPNDRILTAFNRAKEVKDMMRSISDVRSKIERAIDRPEKDPLFYPLNFNKFRADCLNAYRELKQCQPHAVCPYCAGDGCRVCAQQGWVNQLTYDNYVPEDLKRA